MLVDTIVYSLLGLYLERVLPSKYGAREHPLFFLFPSYWAWHLPTPSAQAANHVASPSFEPPAADLMSGASVEIVGLSKIYGSGRLKKLAVDDLNLSFYSGQISCLLGHNGAGKTTTLAVLTGLYPPTQGDCFVFGYSITRARRAVYRLLGICPQHDVLWHSLTVQEHLHLYATLKGVSKGGRMSAVRAMMDHVGIPEKAHTRAHALSGGMKRKLSVGCALIGGSKAVLLDEPSSGMDPSSRRSMWELLRRAKPGRVLVLTTHYMDEADILADRIAVMSQGKLRCWGSSLFLKARFGLGYTLTMVVDDGGASAALTAKVTARLREHIPEAELLSCAGDELAYRLPFFAAPRFGALLTHLDGAKGELGVGSYGMSVTSMEEVFLRLAQGDEVTGGATAPIPAPAPSPSRYYNKISPVSEAERPTSAGSVASQSRVEVELEPVSAMPPNAEGRTYLPISNRQPAARLALHNTSSIISSSPPASPPVSPPASPPASPPVSPPASSPAGDATDADADAPSSGARTPPSFIKQLSVLLQKRWTCAKRDRRAMVTQQVLPLGLVALTLLILTVEDPRVGPALKMHAGIFQRYRWNALAPDPPTEFVSTAPQSTELLRQMNTSALVWHHVNAPDSLNLSHYLLDTYNSHVREIRMGAGAVADTIFLNVHVGNAQSPARGITVPALLPAENGVLAAAVLGCSQSRPNAAFDLLRLVNPNLNGSATLPSIGDLATGGLAALAASQSTNLSAVLVNGAADVASGDSGSGDAGSGGSSANLLTTLTPLLASLLGTGTTGADLLALLPTPGAPGATSGLTLESALGGALFGGGPTGGRAVDGGASDIALVCDVVNGALDSAVTSPTTNAANSTFAGASLLRGLGALRINDEPASNVAIRIALDSAARGLLEAVATGFANVQWGPALAPIAALLAPFEGALEMPTGATAPILIALQESFVRTTLRTILTAQLGVSEAQAEELITTEGVATLLPILRDIVHLIPQLQALDDNPNGVARVQLLEERDFSLASIFAAAAAVSSGQPAAAPLAAFAANGAPVSIGPLTMRNMAVRMGEVRITNTGFEIINLMATAVGEVAVAGTATRLPPMPLSLTAARVRVDHEVILASDLSYVYGAQTGADSGLVFNASSTPPPLSDVEWLNLSMPVPLTLLHNSSSNHAFAAFLGEATIAAWDEAHALRAGGTPPTNTTGGAAPYSYAVYNAPLPLTRRQSLDVKLILALLSSIFLLIPFCYIPAAAAVFVVRERISKSKHLQLVSGANATVYWAATYVWDVFVYSGVTLACMGIFALYGEPSFVSTPTQAFGILAVIWIYGVSVLPLIYCYSFLFDSPTTAQISIIIFNIVASFAMVLAHQIMAVLPNTMDADAVLVWFYRVLPGYNFGEAVIKITTSFYENELLGATTRPLDWDVAGMPCLFMAIETVVYFLILMRLERAQEALAKLEPCLASLCGQPEPSLSLSFNTRAGVSLAALVAVFVLAGSAGDAAIIVVGILIVVAALGAALAYERHLRRGGQTAEARARAELDAREGGSEFVEEEDVAAERQRVEGVGADGASENAVWITHLRKVYPARGRAAPKVAVVDLSLGVPRAECFGFLGVNGAGKTTTLSILTGDYLPSSGRAWIDGHDVVADRHRVRERMGYCPQADPLIELMTARETLVMFARLKNIPEASIPRVVRSLLERVTLTPYADRVAGSYSGGNKRKLSLAIALVGSPAVVFLDEPSSGMDPVSRRHMWDIITRERSVRSIVLTTHSMEECEALCTRIGIMTAGRLQCLGGQQHLKSKYGGGYTLEMRVAAGREEAILAAVPTLFAGAILEHNHAGKLRYELPINSVSLAAVFEIMEAKKEALGVLDYSCSQPSLESIFLAIAERDINRKLAAGPAPPAAESADREPILA